MPISLKANSDGSAEILNGVVSAITISPNGNIKASGMQGYNYIINGNFDIWQRGTSQTTSGYGSDDRWFNGNEGTTKTHSRQSFAVGETFPDGVICPSYYSRTIVSSVLGVTNQCLKWQKMEGVNTLSGRKATLTFYAKASAPKNMSIELVQDFGTGGSPSAHVLGIGVQKIGLTTAWQRFVITVDIPSISGKTLGTTGNDCLTCVFWFDAGSNFNTRTDSLGHQSGTFDIAAVSLVEGDVDIKPIPRSYGEELALCQRYFQLRHVDNFVAYGVAGNALTCVISNSVAMRAAPIVHIISSPSYTNTSSAFVNVGENVFSHQIGFTIVATGAGVVSFDYSLSAEL